ncbi:hypothetical protein MTR67_036138 [Solanum verrucosum]|uniref:Uncharacterized protein n=1 Tax=Solanum verrucosum TaxID=315347 RepID=A0AAF0ZM57_SOLVR|nr:hypothetical protein MTR67_036138 [Solanum verrucosum]
MGFFFTMDLMLPFMFIPMQIGQGTTMIVPLLLLMLSVLA